MRKSCEYIIFIVLGVFSISLFSQTKENLKSQKMNIENEIAKTKSLLNKTKKTKTKSLNYLNTLNKQINNKEMFLKAIILEAKTIDNQIKKTEENMFKIEENISFKEESLARLKKEYSKMIFASFKKKGKRNNLMFVISSEDFNQAYKRMIYLKQYASFRKHQTVKIKQAQDELKSKRNELLTYKVKLELDLSLKRKIRKTQKQEIQNITDSKQEKESLIRKLSKSEKRFKKELQEKKVKAKQLEDQIRKIIEEEIKKERLLAEKRSKEVSLTPEAVALSKEFNSNKGKLPWPLSKGIIVQKYGKQKHPILKGIETFNNGVNILTDKNAAVRTVFDGTVSRIFFIKGQGKAILINHGEFFSVYSGLKSVSVKAGDKLLAKENIGTVLTQEIDNKTELHFEIWKGYEKKDPSKWLFQAY